MLLSLNTGGSLTKRRPTGVSFNYPSPLWCELRQPLGCEARAGRRHLPAASPATLLLKLTNVRLYPSFSQNHNTNLRIAKGMFTHHSKAEMKTKSGQAACLSFTPPRIVSAMRAG